MRAITFEVSESFLGGGLDLLSKHGDIAVMVPLHRLTLDQTYRVTIMSRQFPDGPDCDGTLICSRELSPDGLTYTFKTRIELIEPEAVTTGKDQTTQNT